MTDNTTAYDAPCPRCGHLATFHDGNPCDHPAAAGLCGCTYVLPSGVDRG